VPASFHDPELLNCYLIGMLPDEVEEQVEQALLSGAVEVREPSQLLADPLLATLRAVHTDPICEPPALPECVERLLELGSGRATQTVDEGVTPAPLEVEAPPGEGLNRLGVFCIVRKIGGGGMGSSTRRRTRPSSGAWL
jgi:hypothetical protein